MLSYQFLQLREANAHLTTLQNRYIVLKMQTRIMQTQQLLGFSRFPSQHLEESWSDLLCRKKSNWVKNLYSQEDSSVSFWAALIETQNSGFLTFCLQPDDLSPMPWHTVFWKIETFEIVLLYKTFLRMLKKIGELTGAVDIYFLTSQKVFSATIN